MKYDFDAVQDRSRNYSAKYDERKMKSGTDKVIPLWIADMDFKTAQPVIDAMKARAEEGIWGYNSRPAGPDLNDGCTYGRSLNGYMRLNAACPRSILKQAMHRLEAAVNSL